MDCKDLLRIDDATYRRILAEIHSRSSCGTHSGKRLAERFGLAVEKPFIAVFNYMKRADREAFLVRPFDVSASGMGFLHGRMEYTSTPVLVLARDLEGTMHKIEGKVAHTRLVAGRMHAVGITIAANINPLQFAQDSTTSHRDRLQSSWQMKWTDLLQISTEEVDEIIADIHLGDDPRRRCRRKDIDRVEFREGAVLIITHPDEPDRRHRYRVIPMNLSETGFGFLHGMFLHPGTPCDMMLMALSGSIEIVRGKVVRCELVRGKVHQVGLQFTKTIDLTSFIASGSSSHDAAA